MANLPPRGTTGGRCRGAAHPDAARDRAASIDRGIRDLVAGRSDGAALFHLLYDHVLDEPVPQRLRDLLRA